MPLSYTQTPFLLPYSLSCCFTTDVSESSAPPIAGAVLGEPPSALSGDVCSVSAAERRETRPAREQLCKSGGKQPLGRHLGEEEMPSPSTGTAQEKQGACKGVRSLQGLLSTVISCKGCELAAWGSLKPPGRSQLEERILAQVLQTHTKQTCTGFLAALLTGRSAAVKKTKQNLQAKVCHLVPYLAGEFTELTVIVILMI